MLGEPDPDALDDMPARTWYEWAAYFDWLDTRKDKLDFYLAQIAGYASQKSRFKLSEFMIQHGAKKMNWKEAQTIVKAMYGKP